MHPPIPISPYAWWLLQLALAVLLVRWASKVLKSVSTGLLIVAVVLWLFWRVPGFDEKVSRFWHQEVRPRITEFLRFGKEGIEQGMSGYFDAIQGGDTKDKGR